MGPRPVGGIVRVAVGWAAFAGLIALLWVGMISRIGHYDVAVFLRAGAAIQAGHNPYPTPGTAAVYSGSAFVYPYLTALPFVPLSSLSAAGDLFVAGSVLAVLAGVRLAGVRDLRVHALVLAASTTVIGLQMGTFNALLFAALALAWRARDRALACGTVVALVIYSKVFLVPLLVWLLLARRWRAAGAAGAVLAALIGVSALVSPLGLVDYVELLGQLGRVEARAGISLTGLLTGVGLSISTASRLARLAALVVLAGCWWAARRGHDERLAYTGGVVAALLASPVVWCHYLLLLVAPLLALSRPVTPHPRDGRDPGDGPGSEGGRDTRGGRVPRDRRPVSAGPIALFAAGSWLLVTPHRTTGTDLAVTAVIGLPLVLSCLLSPGPDRTFGARRRPISPDVTLVASRTVRTITFGLLILGLAAVHAADARAAGPYAVCVGLGVILAFAVRSTATPWAIPTSGGLTPTPTEPGPADRVSTDEGPLPHRRTGAP
ncbi:glycosyltransferase 87 family protein [Frankia sp. AgPm24]|uniref:glycosyltransferase 87 family protein n=1 Tax=Frankia sp. AgPm24 TaxID=631128 RepID=UPI00200C2557|nr:glycosyltransferase 87 family protein [Frankia sp. AgPm24]MCK9923886.1 glycosyltransferase 87 family protein [Frankia sp. AgPm24]